MIKKLMGFSLFSLVLLLNCALWAGGLVEDSKVVVAEATKDSAETDRPINAGRSLDLHPAAYSGVVAKQELITVEVTLEELADLEKTAEYLKLMREITRTAESAGMLPYIQEQMKRSAQYARINLNSEFSVAANFPLYSYDPGGVEWAELSIGMNYNIRFPIFRTDGHPAFTLSGNLMALAGEEWSKRLWISPYITTPLDLGTHPWVIGRYVGGQIAFRW